MHQKKPNFFIIGAMKAATTSLYTYLKQHPDIFMTQVKEPMFFNNFLQDKNYKIIGSSKKKINTLKEYFTMFDSVKNEVAIGEASPSYIYNQLSPKLIKQELGDVKIIVVLRNPTDRAYSNYLHTKRSDRENLSFLDAITIESERIQDNWSPIYHYIEKGYYCRQIQRYYNVFPKENIKVLLFEDVIKKTESTLKEIFEFLSVNIDVHIDFSKKQNVSGKPKGVLGFILRKMRYYNLMPKFAISDYLPKMLVNIIFKSVYSESKKLDNDVRKEITNKYYKEEIKNLEKLIDRDLSSWLV